MSDDSKVPLPMGEDSTSDFEFIEMHLLHATFDNREPREGGITGPVQRSYKLPTYFPPFDSSPGSSM